MASYDMTQSRITAVSALIYHVLNTGIVYHASWFHCHPCSYLAARDLFCIQAATEQRRHKLSYHLQQTSPEADQAVLQHLRESLAAAGLAAKVIYSGGVDVDVLAEGAGKGKALEFVLRELQEAGAYPPDGVQVGIGGIGD